MPPRQFRPRGAGEPFRYATPRDDEPPAGEPGDEDQDDEDQDDEEPGGREPGRTAGGGAGIMHDGPGVLLALLAYPLAVNLLRGGPAQMWAWVRAKFLNQTSAAGSGAQQNTPPSQGTPASGAQKNNANPLNPRTPPTPTTTRTRQ